MLEEHVGVVGELVGGEGGERPHGVPIQLPGLDHVLLADALHVLLLLAVDHGQVLEDHVQQLLLGEGQEEIRVVIPGVGHQEDAHPAGEVVAGVVDEAGGAVGDGLATIDAVLLPEPLGASQEDLGGAGVVHGAQGMELGQGELGLEPDVPGGSGGGGDQDVIGQHRLLSLWCVVGHPDLVALSGDGLHRAVEADDVGQRFPEGLGELVEAAGDSFKPEKKQPEVRGGRWALGELN